MEVCKIPGTIQEEITKKYEDIKSKIQESSGAIEYKEEILQFLKFIEDKIREFFQIEYAGSAIKNLFSYGDKTVNCMDFEYANGQFKAFYDGMLRYIDESKDKDLSGIEVRESIDKVINNIFNFMDASFSLSDGSRNPEKPMSVADALCCANMLILLKEEFGRYSNIEYTNTYLDKMIALTILAYGYYASVNMMNQICKINDAVLGVTPSEPAKVKFTMV